MGKDRYPKKTVYYQSYDADFVKGLEGKKKIDSSYVYIKRGLLSRVISFFLYRIIATPVAFVYSKLFMREKFVGKEKLRGHKSYFLYAGHNEPVSDAFSPSILSFPKRAYTVIHPDNLALPVLGGALRHLGGLPTPSDIRSARNFSLAVGELVQKGKVIVVYPEAHVWPKCVDVRPFAPGAFDMALGLSAPVFSLKRVYKKSRIFGWRAVSYVDGPFYPDLSLPKRERREVLSGAVESAMRSHIPDNEVEIIKYERKDV